MEFSNDTLKKISSDKTNYNKKYQTYLYRMYKETKLPAYIEKSRRIGDCMNYWLFDKYDKNKILDLVKVNRCNNNRFCPNCKKIDISKFIYKFKDIIKQYSDYNYYFLTLTIPNCSADDLAYTIDKMNRCFARLKEKLSYPLFNNNGKRNKKAFANRHFTIDGGIRVLEINYNGKKGYHPHYHCVVLLKDNPDQAHLEKIHTGRYSTKRKQIDMKSDIEYQISKLWSLIWYEDDLRLYDSIPFNLCDTEYSSGKKVLEVDFKEFDYDGIYEVFKYTFKDKDITSFHVFETLYFALQNKRIRQGFGCLYNVKLEDIEVGETQGLELVFEEEPEELFITQIQELYTTYKEYTKLSRFNTTIDDNIK